MGQKKAIFYKYWILTKKQKCSFCCQVVTPLLCLGLIKLIMVLVNNVTISKGGLLGSSVVPSNIYPCNLLTPKWIDYFNGLFRIEYPVRINRWAVKDPELKESFSYWLKHQPNIFTFEVEHQLLGTQKFPRWDYEEDASNEGLNQHLIRDIKFLNSIEASDLSYEDILPDSVNYIRRLDLDKGVDVGLQINNILFWKYHRYNGDQLYDIFVQNGQYSVKFGNKTLATNGNKPAGD